MELYNSASQELTGPVDFRHEFVNMETLYVEEAGPQPALRPWARRSPPVALLTIRHR